MEIKTMLYFVYNCRPRTLTSLANNAIKQGTYT